MGFLSIRFKLKSLILVGIAFYAIGALCSSFAFNLFSMSVFQFFLGIGGSIVTIMTYALIGAYLPTEKRAGAIGLVWSVVFITNVVVTPLTGILDELAGWRAFLSWFIFPVGIASLIIAYIGFPKKQPQTYSPTKELYLKAFKEVLTNKSTVACILSTMLVSIFATTPTYAPSFLRSTFGITATSAGLISALVGSTGIFGGLLVSRFMNQIGRRNLAIFSGIISGVFVALFTFIPNLWISVLFWGIAAFAVSMTWAALFGLTLEQIPSFQGTTMSMNQSFRYLGAILGLVIGGVILNQFAGSYQLLMVAFGCSNIALSFLILLFAKDPCK